MSGFMSGGSPEAQAHYERTRVELGAAERAQLIHAKKAESFKEMLKEKRKRI